MAEGPHVFVQPNDVAGDQAVIRTDDAHHLGRVRRLTAGAPVSVADGHGTVWQGHVRHVGDELTVGLAERTWVPPPRPALTVVHALPKGRKLDEVVQRLSEVGADRLVPVTSARSEVRLDPARSHKAKRRWDAVGLAAAKQSRRARPMMIDPVGKWADLAELPDTGAVLWEEARDPFGAVINQAGSHDPDELVLAVEIGRASWREREGGV